MNSGMPPHLQAPPFAGNSREESAARPRIPSCGSPASGGQAAVDQARLAVAILPERPNRLARHAKTRRIVMLRTGARVAVPSSMTMAIDRTRFLLVAAALAASNVACQRAPAPSPAPIAEPPPSPSAALNQALKAGPIEVTVLDPPLASGALSC